MLIIRLLFKNTFRHKLRTFLTVIGMAIAILSFGVLRTVINAWYAGVEASSADRLVTRNAISIIFPLPLSYKEKIRQIEGVTIVSYGNWFGGVYIDEKNFFANFAVDPESYLRLYPEYVLSPGQYDSFLRDRKGFVAGRKLAGKYGWKLGDTVVLKGTIYPGDWEFVLRAVYKGRYNTTDESQFFFSWDYLNETMKKTNPVRADKAGFYLIGVADPALASGISVAIDNMFKNSIAETRTETEKAFQMGFVSMSEAILVAIQFVSLVIILIILVVVANTMAMTARERFREYAVLKTIGFGRRHIAGLIFGESLLITAIGCALGIALTFPSARVFGSSMSQFFPVFIVSDLTVYLDIAASLIVGLTAAFIPAYRAMNINIIEGLRRIG